MTEPAAALTQKLERVAAHERGARKTLLNALLLRLGPKPWFAAIYSRIGPALDRFLLRRWGGRVATRMYGLPALLLVTTGAKTGQRRTSPLLYVRDGDAFVVVGTNFGTAPHPAWTANLLAHAAAQITVGDETLDVHAQLADDASFARLWPKLASMYPGYDDYRARLTQRVPRMFILQPYLPT